MLSILCPDWQEAPFFSSHLMAAFGNSCPKSSLGSNRSELPTGPKSASFMMRKKTLPLASCAGVLSAETHSGSIKSCQTVGVMFSQRSATVSCSAHSKCMRCHCHADLNNCHLSAALQLELKAMPCNRLRGNDLLGSDSPEPSAYLKSRGFRQNAFSKSMPTSGIIESVF